MTGTPASRSTVGAMSGLPAGTGLTPLRMSGPQAISVLWMSHGLIEPCSDAGPVTGPVVPPPG